MKKIIAIALAVLMLATLAVPAFAAASVEIADPVTKEEGETHSSSAEVTYGVSQTYTVILPSAIKFGTNGAATTSADIEVTELVIAGNNKLVVTMDSVYDNDANGWEMRATNGSDPVDYTVTGPAEDADATDHVIPALNAIANAKVAPANDETQTPEVPATTVLTVNSNVEGEGGKTTLTFATNGTMQAGNYKDTITFGVAVVAK